MVASGVLATAGAASASTTTTTAGSPRVGTAIAPAAVDPDFKVLVFSKTAGFRHGSIPAGIAAIQQLGAENNFSVDTTEDGASFTTENLAQYDVVVWMSTTGDVLSADQQAAFEDYIENGGGYAGVHAASDTEYDWPWYGELVGAYFAGHPAEQNATVKVEDHAHPSTSHLGDTWTRYDEWYNFRSNPRGNVHVLASLDEKSYTGGTMGIDHPTTWCQNYDGGRSWYTGGGHTDASYSFRLVRGDRDVFGLHGRSAEQRVAIDMLLDPEVGIVSLGGRAGTGKSALALCAGLEAVLEKQQHKKIMVFRPLYAVGGQELGFLPGDAAEKMNPWAQAVFDTLGSLVSQNVLDEVIDRGMLEVLPLTHIRGRSLHDAFVIVDEAQSLERNVLLTVLSRIGQNSRVVLTHDVAQRDNLRVGRHDGVASVIETLKGHALFGHITLTRSERSAIAALVTEMLESNELA